MSILCTTEKIIPCFRTIYSSFVFQSLLQHLHPSTNLRFSRSKTQQDTLDESCRGLLILNRRVLIKVRVEPIITHDRKCRNRGTSAYRRMPAVSALRQLRMPTFCHQPRQCICVPFAEQPLLRKLNLSASFMYSPTLLDKKPSTCFSRISLLRRWPSDDFLKARSMARTCGVLSSWRQSS
jgi:hypothetical protein